MDKNDKTHPDISKEFGIKDHDTDNIVSVQNVFPRKHHRGGN